MSADFLTGIPVPRYAVGDRVWDVDVSRAAGRHPCPDCLDTRTWTVMSRAGETFEISCLRCSTSYPNLPNALQPLAYETVSWSARELTIGSVQINTAPTHGEHPVAYMCLETGVGSGRVYYEDGLFPDKASAKAAAEARAAEWQAKLDAGPINPIRAEAAKWTLSAALPRTWEEDVWHAWGIARDLTDLLEEMLEDEHQEYGLERAARARIEEELQPKSWRRPQPVQVLVDAVRAFLDNWEQADRETLRAALEGCLAPQRRPKKEAAE